MLKGIFINGLKEEIQAELKLHATGTLDELMDRALLLEEKNNALKKGGLMNAERKGGSSYDKGTVKGSKGFTRWEKGGVKEGASSKGGESEASEKKQAGNRLSQAELRERSRKGLCFKCGETWGRDHVCKLKHFQFVLVETEGGDVTEESDAGEEAGEELSVKIMQLSLKNKEGLTSNRSFKVIGTIRGVQVLALVDCGASSNFIARRVVDNLKLKVTDTSEFVVEVGNGEKVKNQGVCKQVELEV